ncbi:ABC transporter permease [Candidatus Margulisiibacteriota bacterium]
MLGKFMASKFRGIYFLKNLLLASANSKLFRRKRAEICPQKFFRYFATGPIWKKLFKSKLTRIAFYYLLILILAAVFIPMLSSADPNYFDTTLANEPEPPNIRHIFGTDDLGRDLFIRCIHGARISLSVGFISVGISIFIGIIIGLVSGYVSGFLDEIIMRIIELFMAIPKIFLLLIIQVLLKPSIFNVMVVIGLTSWMGVSRLVRSEVLSIKERDFIVAAKARGCNHWRILFKHILPHILNPVIVAAMLGIGNAILIESVLSFLGLGVQPPHASWGNMLENSLLYMSQAPWMTIIPGTLITLTVLAINFLGDGLRSCLDTKN